MVNLIQMGQSDFDEFVEHGIAVYAQDNIQSGDWNPDETVEKSREEFRRLLPDGLNTKDQYLFTIRDENLDQKIGFLWVQVKENASIRKAFICDLIIDPQFRGQGYGKQALQALDEKLIRMNVESVSLHVFAHNTNAIALYERSGFSATNLYMGKTLRPILKTNIQ